MAVAIRFIFDWLMINEFLLMVGDENVSPLVMEVRRQEDGLAVAIRLIVDWLMIYLLIIFEW